MSGAAQQGLGPIVRRQRLRERLGAAIDAAAWGLVAAALGAVVAARWAGGLRDATAGALLAGAIVGGLVGAAGGAALSWEIRRRRRRGAATRPAELDAARHLDATVPAAEWSAELLATPIESLGPLERLQRQRVEQALAALPPPVLPRGSWTRPLAHLLIATLAAAGLLAFLLLPRTAQTVGTSVRAAGATAPPPESGPALAGVRIEIDPPAYTRLPPHFSDGWPVRAEEGARVRFRVEVRGEVDRAVLRFGDEEVPLVRGDGGIWQAERRAQRGELYSFSALRRERVVLHGPLARLDVVRDEPPVLQVLRPAPLTLVAAQAPGVLAVEVTARDDYAVAGVEAHVTVAHGNGEQVTFRELRRPLQAHPGGRYAMSLDLGELGIAPGVEAYVSVEARDNREPEPGRTRSATLRIRSPQPGEERSVSLAGGIALQTAVEMFRSERQIILDTQQLLREQRRLPAATVEKRAQNLGFDQRALRLRYGALLGEEVESGVAVEAATAEVHGTAASHGAVAGHEGEEHDHETAHPAGGGGGLGGAAGGSLGGSGSDHAAALAQVLPEGMVHLHDSAASATFFPEELRREMRDVLTEMWGAEGHLRGIQPHDALPFEERALRKLKDVQQRSRAYVPKVGFTSPEVDPARRLTGDLAAIQAQSATRTPPAADRLRELYDWTVAACSPKPASVISPTPPVAPTSPGAPTSPASPRSPTPTAPPLDAAARIAGERALAKAALDGDAEALTALAVWRTAAHPGCREARSIAPPLWRLLTIPPPALGRAGEDDR